MSLVEVRLSVEVQKLKQRWDLKLWKLLRPERDICSDE